MNPMSSVKKSIPGTDLDSPAFIQRRVYLSISQHRYHTLTSIHPSMKSPLAGAAWNFSQSQARQPCNAGLTVTTSSRGRFKGKALQSCCWKEVMDVRSVFTRVNLTVGNIQKVVGEVVIRRMFTDPEITRLYWQCHLFVSPACTAQFCTRCAFHYSNIPNEMIPSNYNKTWTVFLMHACLNLFSLCLKYTRFSKKNHNDLIGTETELL